MSKRVNSVGSGVKSDENNEAPGRGEIKASALETASYIADLAGEMALMAKAAKLHVLAFLLDLARAEAQDATLVSAAPHTKSLRA